MDHHHVVARSSKHRIDVYLSANHFASSSVGYISILEYPTINLRRTYNCIDHSTDYLHSTFGMPPQQQGPLLSPLPKRPGRRQSIVERFRDKCIEYQLKRDQRRFGPISQVNIHNQQSCPLLNLPAELRNAIWKLAIVPYYDTKKHAFTHINDRSLNVYPDRSILAASRTIRAETHAMYDHAVGRFWEESSLCLTRLFPLSAWDESRTHVIPRIDWLNDNSLGKVTSLVLASEQDVTPLRRHHSAKLTFHSGTWCGRWQRRLSFASFANFETRYVVLFEVKVRGVMRNMVKDVQHERLQNHAADGLRGPYDSPLEAVMFPEDTDKEVLAAVQRAARFEKLTKRILKAMVYFQWYTCDRY